MRKIEKFEAFDGKEFDNEIDCVTYENGVESTKKYSSYNSPVLFEDAIRLAGFKNNKGCTFYWKKNAANRAYQIVFNSSEIEITGESRTKINGVISGIDPTLLEFKILINLLMD